MPYISNGSHTDRCVRRLMLNGSKTGVVIVCTEQKLTVANNIRVIPGNCLVSPMPVAENLGIIYDTILRTCSFTTYQPDWKRHYETGARVCNFFLLDRAIYALLFNIPATREACVLQISALTDLSIKRDLLQAVLWHSHIIRD